MGKQNEPSGYAEVGTYLHEDEGKAKIKTYTSVNAPLKVDASERTRQVKKIRVETHVYEDKSVGDNCVYEKNVETIQVSGDGLRPSINKLKEQRYEEPEESEDFEESEEKDSLNKGERFLKNMIKSQNAWLIFVAGVSVLALVVAVVAFALI